MHASLMSDCVFFSFLARKCGDVVQLFIFFFLLIGSFSLSCTQPHNGFLSMWDIMVVLRISMILQRILVLIFHCCTCKMTSQNEHYHYHYLEMWQTPYVLTLVTLNLTEQKQLFLCSHSIRPVR